MSIARQCLERRDVVVAKHRWYDDARQPSLSEKVIHRNARRTPVTVGERMYFGDREHGKCGTIRRRCGAHDAFVSLRQRPHDHLGAYEVSLPGAVGLTLDLSGSFIES